VISIDENKGSATARSQVVNGIVPEQPGYVRLKRSQASWTFTTIPGNRIAATYEISFDPNGNVPPWLINLFITEGPYESLSNMKQIVREPKYLNAGLRK
jgi:hypothetical protein